MPKDSFILYTKYSEQISLLNMEQAGVLFVCLLNYQSGKELPKMDAVTEMCFSFIKAQMDSDNEKYEETVQKRAEAGKRGGRPKANDFDEEFQKANGFSEKQTKAKKANGFSEKQNNPDNDNENENENENENDNDICPSLSEREEILVNKKLPCAHEEAVKDLSPSPRNDDLKAFLDENPNVIIDSCATGTLSGIDFKRLREEFSQTPYLRDKPHELSWICKKSAGIIGGAYRKFDSGGGGENGKSDGLNEALTEAERKANEAWFDELEKRVGVPK